jgi:hypothetical protein
VAEPTSKSGINPGIYGCAFGWRISKTEKDSVSDVASAFVTLSQRDWIDVMEDYIAITRKRIKNRIAMAKVQLHIAEDIMLAQGAVKHYRKKFDALVAVEGTSQATDSGVDKKLIQKEMFLHRASANCFRIIGDGIAWRALVTGPTFCTTVSERVYITDRTGFFVPTLRRVFGCLMPNGIAASRDSIGEFVGCPLSESPVRTALIIFLAPSLDTLLRFRQGSEPMRVQALRSERPVEGFEVSVVGWFPRSAEIDLYSVLVGPEVHDLTGELGPVITEKHLRHTPFESKSI